MKNLTFSVLGVVLASSWATAEYVQQGGKLVGADAVGQAGQAISVALSAAGDAAIVGGHFDDGGSGAAWVFTRAGAVWSQDGIKLVGSGAVGAAHQGISVALSADAATAMVGGPYDDDGRGAAWVFTRAGGVWSQQGEKLVGMGVGGSGGAGQGSAVALSADGSTAVVGGFNDGGGTGAAWVFTRSGGFWTQQGPKLVGSGALGDSRQGYAVAISADGSTVLVGGLYDNSRTGAAWVFTRTGAVWTQQGGKLVAAADTWLAGQAGSVSLAADGNTAIVGGLAQDIGKGAAVVYTRSGGAWTQQGGRLVGTGFAGFSFAVATVALSADGSTAAVGDYFDDGYAGAAWIFARSGGAWAQEGTKLVGSGAVGGASQGRSVALSGDGTTAVVGGPDDDGSHAGAFDGTGATWVYVAAGCKVPSVIWPPRDVAVAAGQTSTLSVAAAGTAPLSYQWFQGVSGDTSHPVGSGASSFATPVLTSNANYWVRVSNSCGHVDSATATVTVGCTPPSIISQPQSQTIQGGQAVVLSVVAAGDRPLSHQWYQGTSGDTSQPVGSGDGSFTTPALTATTSYWVRVGNACGRVSSTTAIVTVRSASGVAMWFPVVAHNAGKNESQWRSDLGLLNPGTAAANVELRFHGTGSVISNTTSLPAGAQSIIVDVLGQLGVSAQGALEVVSDLPLQLTARTYNQVAASQDCYPNGTQGQNYPALAASDGLSAGQSAMLAGLSENVSYRSNIGLVNTGTSAAEATVELHDGAGALLASYQEALAAGEWRQETQPFRNKAGQTAMDRGYVRVTVTSGSGVFGFTSVVDNITNDPTTVTMATAGFRQQGNKLVGTGAGTNHLVGLSVALASDGNTAIVGSSGAGAWLFARSGGVWTQQGGKLSGVGYSVALSADGGTALVGSGDSALVFSRSGERWTQQGGKLVGTGAVNGAGQGRSVALSADGNTAIVGGPYDDNETGAAWVFTRSGGMWTQQGGKLVGTGAVGGNRGIHQGYSVHVSADGSTVIVGGPEDNNASGAAWVFTRSGGLWTQQGEKLTSGRHFDEFGQSVALSSDGDRALVGSSSGALAFTRTAGVWAQEGERLGPEAFSVALSADGNTAVVGDPWDENCAGAAYAFTRSGGVWMQLGNKVVGSGGVGCPRQGYSVGISGDGNTAVLGGIFDNDVGAAWVFKRPGNDLWVPVLAHNVGKNGSQWRSDLGLLNTGSSTANVQLGFHGPGGVVTSTTSVPAGTQSLLVDVVGQLGTSGQGALEVVSDQPLQVTARTYNLVSLDAQCYPAGTQGQDYPALDASEGLSAGQSALLAGLSENAAYRANIGLINTGPGAGEATVELCDGAGTSLASYLVSLGPGEWKQETQPFLNQAAQHAMDRGYARVTVQAGSGLFAFASVIDNVTNDPTTVVARRW